VAGSLLDLGWAAGYCLFTLAALAPQAARAPEEYLGPSIDKRTMVSSMLVYVPLLLTWRWPRCCPVGWWIRS
jgi:hypothetical protein